MERRNEHLVSKNGLLDITVTHPSEGSRIWEARSIIKESFTTVCTSRDQAKYKILLATRGKLLALLRDVEIVLKDYVELEKLGDPRNGGKW